jgi:hypothetical protein
MPIMQQPEAYFGHVSDDSFDQTGCLKEGPLKDLILVLAHAFHDWVDMIHRSRRLLAEDWHTPPCKRNMRDPSGGLVIDLVNKRNDFHEKGADSHGFSAS